MEDIRLHIADALDRIKDAIDRGDISVEEVERLFLEMLG
jgi:hypothetical protein